MHAGASSMMLRGALRSTLACRRRLPASARASLPLSAAPDARRYYAAYQAMWAAVGEPEREPRWEHFGLMKAFVRGRWFDPQAGMRGPGVFEPQCFAVHRLYDL